MSRRHNWFHEALAVSAVIAGLFKAVFQSLRFTGKPNLNFRIVAKVSGIFLTFFSLTMFLPLLVGFSMGEGMLGEAGSNPFVGFVLSAFICGTTGFLLYRYGSRGEGREGILCVGVIWFVTGIMGGLPFYFANVVGGFWDGVFESVSGLTTTGSSVFGGVGGNAKISDLPASILFWRSWLQWMGGLGIIVMFLVFLPALGITEKMLFQAEVAGVSKEGVKPRIRESAAALLRIYLIITLMLGVGYWVLGMGKFDAVCHSFATIATGGFSTQDYSIGQFQKVGIEVLAILGMLLAATNFGLFHRVELAFKKVKKGDGFLRFKNLPRPKDLLQIFWSDPEFRFFITVFIVLVLLITGNLYFSHSGVVPSVGGADRAHDYGTIHGCLRDSSFQAASLISSTGFANSNLSAWPLLSQFMILVIMLMGGSSGSTGGGLKAIRVLILFKLVGRSLRRFIRPRSIEPIRVAGTKVEADLADMVFALFVLWIAILIFGTLALLLVEPRLDALSAGSSIVTSLCNMGPGLTQLMNNNPLTDVGDISSYGSFGAYSAMGKALMSFVMILGRLEVMTPLILLTPAFWKD